MSEEIARLKAEIQKLCKDNWDLKEYLKKRTEKINELKHKLKCEQNHSKKLTVDLMQETHRRKTGKLIGKANV